MEKIPLPEFRRGIFRFKGPKGAEKTARRDLRRAVFLYGNFTLQQRDTSIFTCFHGVSIPQAHLNLANVAGADQQHAQPGLAMPPPMDWGS